MPDVSVVIPTRERRPALERTLEALAAQELQGIAMEVVVVHNRPRAGSPGVLAIPGLDVRVVEEEVPGAAAARNAGLLAARTGLVLFLGDDCRPARPDFVAGHVRAHAEPGLVVVGRTEWDPEVGVTPVMRWLAETGKMLDFSEPLGPEQLYTGNASVAREAALAVGGFDQRFRGYGWEDTDLGLRLADQGMRMAHRPELLALHAHRYTLRDSLERMRAVGRGANLLRRVHAHREPPPGPSPGRVKLSAARALAPLTTRVPERLAGHRLLQAAHLSALARGEADEPLPDDPVLRGWPLPEGLDGSERPAVSVVVPFLGDVGEAERLVRALEALHVRDGDELLVADNTPGGLVRPGERVRVVAAPEQRSSYHARNAGAEAAGADWLLFVDADCTPRRGLLDAYFRGPIGEGTGAVAGAVRADPRQRGLIARYARSRTHLSQAAHFRDAWRPYAITANLLVRREAWAEVGGFYEGLRSGGDADICWRMQDAGWALEYREHAAVEHRHRETIRGLVRQAARYSAAIAWMDRHHPGSGARPKLVRRLLRALAGAAWWGLTLRPQRALFKAIDAIVVVADSGGFVFSNAAPRPDREPSGLEVVVLVDSFPEPGQSLPAGGERLRVEAAARAARPDRLAARGRRVDYGEDDGIARAAADLAWLMARHPLRCARDVLAREGGRPLRRLAPLARRLHTVGGERLEPHGGGEAPAEARRLARLVGLAT